MKVKIINYIGVYLTLNKNEKGQNLLCGFRNLELQNRVKLRNVDVCKALSIGHSVYNDLKKG